MTSPAEPPRSLQQQLDEITATTRALVPADRLAGTEQLVAELHATGQENRILPVGATMPVFTLKGANGKVVRSEDLLGLGSLVINFFRGRWDPYDITELDAWQKLQVELRHRRTLLIGISPQLPRQNGFTVDQHGITFPLLSDPGCVVAEAFGLAYTVPETSRRYLRSMLVNIPFMNGEETWRLPLPATYVISPRGEILFAQTFADHRLRPEPELALRALVDDSVSEG